MSKKSQSERLYAALRKRWITTHDMQMLGPTAPWKRLAEGKCHLRANESLVRRVNARGLIESRVMVFKRLA